MRCQQFAAIGFLFACILSGCSDSSTAIQEARDEGYKEGYSAAFNSLSIHDLDDELKQEIVSEWMDENRDELIENYRQYFLETDGNDAYWDGFEDACEEFNIPQQEVDAYFESIENSINSYTRQSSAPTGN